MEEIVENSRVGRSVLILGESGIGKTRLLKELGGVYVVVRPPKRFLEKIAEGCDIGTKGKRVGELLEEIMESEKRITILVDELETTTATTTRMLKKIRRKHKIICASQGVVKGIEFDYIVKMNPLSMDGTRKIAREKIKYNYCIELEEIIYRISKGNPAKIIKICEEINERIEFEAFDLEDKKSIHSLAYKIEGKKERFVLLTPQNILSIAYLFLSLRYFFYRKRMYEEGYNFALMAYLIFFIMKRRGRKK